MIPAPQVVIPFARVSADQNPNAAQLGQQEQQAAYARTAAVTFASLRRWNPDLELIYLTNDAPHPLLVPVLDRCRARVETADFTHRPPKGFMATFSGCLFLLDAVSKHRDDNVLYLDPDVVCVRPLAPMIETLGERIGALPMNFPRAEVVNGIDAAGAEEIQRAWEEPEFGGFIGGEALWLPAARGREFADGLERAYRRSLERHGAGLSHYTTEEHLFSSLLSGREYASLEAYTRRIWTTSRYRTVAGDEDELFLWHLPSEKDLGFGQLYPQLLDAQGWFWTSSQAEFAARVGVAMSLHHRSPKKLLRDAAGQLANRVARGSAAVRRTATSGRYR